MCLSIPAEIIEINEDMAKVSIAGNITNAGLHFIEDPQIGDFVLLHSGYAIQVISKKEADETLAYLNEMLEKQQMEGESDE